MDRLRKWTGIATKRKWAENLYKRTDHEGVLEEICGLEKKLKALFKKDKEF